MTLFTLTSHPTFEELSALADREGHAERPTRAERHVARCADCRSTILEIRQLGDAARSLPVGAASDELWSRIEAAASTGVELLPEATDGAAGVQPAEIPEDVVAPAPRGGRRRTMVALVLAAAAIVVAMVVWPARAGLMASGTSRLTFTPGRPVPGGTMTVRYEPAPWFRGAPRLVLVGRFERPPSVGREEPSRFDSWDSLATLLPTSDGTYVGRVTLPADFLAVRMMVFDSTGNERDADGILPWTAIGGNRDRTPSLTALLAGHVVVPTLVGADSTVRRAMPRQVVSVADSIQRYFPGHPAGWSLYSRYGMVNGISDLVRFFETAERKYASLDATLWPKPNLDVESIRAMAMLAGRIEEPAEAAKWTLRFVREHPEHPDAMEALADVLHSIELREPPQLADSIRPWFPLLDTLFRRSHTRLSWSSRVPVLVSRYADSATRATWSDPDRAYRSSFNGPQFLRRPVAEIDSAFRAEVRASCDRAPGEFPLPGATEATYQCRVMRSWRLAHLSRAMLAQGRADLAEQIADSAVAGAAVLGAPLASVATVCYTRLGFQARGRARLARGDTLGAARDFALQLGEQGSRAPRADSLPVWLGRHYDESRFRTVADSANRAASGCRQRHAEWRRLGDRIQARYD